MEKLKRTILVVDDDIDFLEQTQLVLKNAGFDTVSAESQKEAQKLLEEVKPDLAIVDLMMEHYDSGFILSYNIKKKYPDIPVIIATAVTSETGMHFDSQTKNEKDWVKADLIMDKGIRHDQLIGEIKKLLKD
jgi:CheY-like chemotaxis protein